jgi:hypothetical protein
MTDTAREAVNKWMATWGIDLDMRLSDVETNDLVTTLADAERHHKLVWTTQKPTRAGYYWWRGQLHERGKPGHIIEVREREGRIEYEAGYEWYPIDTIADMIEWSSQPIAGPEEA